MNIALVRFAFALICWVSALSCVDAQVTLAPAKPQSTQPQATKPAATPTGRPEPVLIAFVYRDAVTESAWTQSHELARKAVDAEFGARVHTITVERVATAADSDRVFRDLATRGYKVIFATDAIHSDAAARMAAADYDIKIEQAMGAQELINMRVYSIRHFEQAYLAGIIAAGNSTTAKLGFIAATATPAARAEVNAFTLGAQSVNKRATTQLIWTGSRSDAVADASAAEALIKHGADVLVATTDSMAAAEVAQRRRKRIIGWHVDRSALAPHAHVATVALDWAPFYKTAIRESFDYLCTKADTSRGYREGAITVVGLSKSISNTAKARLARVQSELAVGTFQVFTGPIMTNSDGAPSAVMLADKVVGDEAWRKSMKHLVRGVTVLTLPQPKVPTVARADRR